MGLKTFLITTALAFTQAACSLPPQRPDTSEKEAALKRVAGQLPDLTATDPVSGCRYIKTDGAPDKTTQCLPNKDFPLDMK